MPRHRSLSSALAPIIIHFTQQRWIWSEENRLDAAELHSQSQTELFLLSLSEQMRHDSTGFILVYEAFLVALQERCTTYHMTKSYRPSLPPYLVNLIQQRRRILCLYRSTRIRRAPKFSVFSEQVHSSWTESGQASSMARVLPRTRAEKYATLLEPFEEPFQEASDSNTRVSGWERWSSVDRRWYHDWTRPSILLGGFQRKWHAFSESRSSQIQATSGREVSRTSVETISVHHQRSASIYPTTENENI